MDYEARLDRALAEAPDIEGEASRFQLPDPEVRQECNATVFENVQAVAERLDRDPDHLMGHLQNEVGTSAAVDERGQLRLTGELAHRGVRRRAGPGRPRDVRLGVRRLSGVRPARHPPGAGTGGVRQTV